MSIAAAASHTQPVEDESARPTLFAPGGPLNPAQDPDHPAPESPRPDGGSDTSADPTPASELFSTRTRDQANEDLDGSGDAPIDLREGAVAAPTQGPRDVALDRALLETMATAAEAIEYIERARGHLYTLHHLLVRADILFADVATSLRDQGHADEAEILETRVIGRDVIDDRWSFEVVEAFEDGFYGPISGAVRDIERRTVGGRRHALDAALKQARARSDVEAEPRD